MNKRRPHRPRLGNLTRPGASSVTATLPGIAAAAAILPGLGAHTAPVPAAAAPDTSVSDTAVIHEAMEHRVLAVRSQPDAAMPRYTVKSGDTLSGIAASHCGGKAQDWTGIYAASHLKGSANVIQPGEELAVSCTYDPSLLDKATTAVQVRHLTTAAVPVSSGGGHRDRFDGGHGACGDGDEDGMDASCSDIFGATAAPQQRTAVTVAAPSGGSVRAGGSYEACVIARESGGQTQVMNASGHYGLYQFDLGTWESGGGSAAEFGHASAATQQQVFRAVYAARGTQPWSPSDGC